MEMTTEITKVFGNEMAKLFASTVSEEEMKKTASEVWEKLKKHECSGFGTRYESELEKLIKAAIIDKVMEKVDELLQRPRDKEALNREAANIVLEARKKANEMIIENLAEGMAKTPFIDYNLQQMAAHISHAINCAMNR